MRYIRKEIKLNKWGFMILVLLWGLCFYFLYQYKLNFIGEKEEFEVQVFSKIRFYTSIIYPLYFFMMTHHLFEKDMEEVMRILLKHRILYLIPIMLIYLILSFIWLMGICHFFQLNNGCFIECLILLIEISIIETILIYIFNSPLLSTILLILMNMFYYFFLVDYNVFNYLYPGFKLSSYDLMNHGIFLFVLIFVSILLAIKKHKEYR